MTLDPFAAHEPPQSLDDERAVLGSILLSPECLEDVVRIVQSVSMYHPAHALILEACLALRNRDVPIDARTLHHELIRTGDLERIGGPDYLASLMEVVPSAANAAHYAEIVREKYVLRSIIRSAYDALGAAHEAGANADEVLARVQASLGEVAKGRCGGIRSASWKEAATELLAEIEAVRAGAAEMYLPTGFIDLDRMIGGFKPGHMVVLGGRPGQGKSTWAMNLAVDCAFRRKKAAAMMTWEMSQFEVAQTVMSVYARIPPSAMEHPKMASDEDMTSMRGAVAVSEDVPLHLTCHAGMGVSDLRAEARRYKREYGIELLIVDYVQLVDVPKQKGTTRDQDVSETSRALKTLAGELDIVVLALSSLNRRMDTERRDPVLADLRECGSLEYDANTVIFLHRPHEADPTDNAVKVIVAKNRTGPVGDVALAFRKAQRQFCNAERDEKRA